MKLRISRVISRAPMKHQSRYLRWAAVKNDLACFMEMRLGKTLANIRAVRQWSTSVRASGGRSRPVCYPVLVVCPAAVLNVWEHELNLEGELNVFSVHGKSFDRRIKLTLDEAFSGKRKGRVWILINYECLLYTPGLSLLPWFTVILDESIIIKNPAAKISKLCCAGFQDVMHKIVLTGLPSPEGELNLFNQFKFLYGEFMGCTNFYDFRARYFRMTPKGYQPLLGMKTKIKNYVHKRAFILTRFQAKIGSKKIRETRTVKMSAEQEKEYLRAEQEFLAVWKDENGFDNTVETDHVISQRIWMARIAGGCDIKGQYVWNAKTKELISLLKGELYGMPVVVWFRFNAEIEAVATELTKAKIDFQTITGADNKKQKKEKQQWFNDHPNPSRVILAQKQKVCEHGVDMSVSDVAIYYSYSYSASTNAQTEERILNPKKKTPLLYIYLITEDTVDEDAHFAITNKVRSARMFLSDMDEHMLMRTLGLSLGGSK